VTGAAGRSRLEAIILAGGAGCRFGGGKLLAPYRGGALIDGAVRSALLCPVERVILVTGHDGARVGQAATALAKRQYPDRVLDIVHAEGHAEGMATSLRTGLAALSVSTDGVFIFLGDMPDIPPDVAHALLASIGEAVAAVPEFGGRRGHPVLVKRDLFRALTLLKGDTGARTVLDGLGEGLVRVPASSAGVLFDVDQPLDLAS
jgi:molybdenum cofactor cytidylyltransferase